VTKPLYLLDTNICIYLLEALSEPARRRVQDRYPGEVATSAVVFAEVARGIDWSDQDAVEAVDRLFTLIPVLPFDQTAALTYARLPFRRARFDRLIAGHALALGLTLVTNNVADFRDVADLRVENWAED
jgi:tRNA(fMet)-specific endonuclease VapC